MINYLKVSYWVSLVFFLYSTYFFISETALFSIEEVYWVALRSMVVLWALLFCWQTSGCADHFDRRVGG